MNQATEEYRMNQATEEYHSKRMNQGQEEYQIFGEYQAMRMNHSA